MNAGMYAIRPRSSSTNSVSIDSKSEGWATISKPDYRMAGTDSAAAARNARRSSTICPA